MTTPPSREVPIDPAHAALLFIDVQNYAARRDGGEYQGLSESAIDQRYGFFFRTLRDTALPNMQRLQAACRQGRIEVLYTVIESLTRDGRDRSLGVRSLMLAGILTDQCVDSTARDACDLGYLVTIITDACATHSRDRHEWSLRNNRGYARQQTTSEIVTEIARVTASGIREKAGF